MKKTLLLIGFTVLISALYAQSTILGTYLPVVNTEIKQVWNLHPNLSTTHQDSLMAVPSYGANQVWDYSASFPITGNLQTHSLITYSPDSTDDVRSPSGMALKTHFPNASLASFVESPFEAADSLWSFFRVDTTGMYAIGHYVLKAPIVDPNLIFADTTIKMIDEELIIPFKVDYNDTFYDVAKQEMFFKYNVYGNVSDIKYIRTTQTEFIIRGFGQLVTPLETTDDVLLGVATVLNIDSLFINNNGVYTPIPNSMVQGGFQDSSYVVRHFFLANNTFATNLLMQINTDITRNFVSYGWYVLPSKVGTISGTVFNANDMNPIYDGKVLLYREHGNFRKNDVLDSAQINPDGTYTFNQIPYGQYRLLARAENTIYENALSTFYEEFPDLINNIQGTSWTNSDLVVTTRDTTGIDIYVKNNSYTSSSIPNEMTGTLKGYTPTKYLGNDPIKGIDIIILKDPSSQPIISTQTDTTGRFTFENLQDGNYKIWVDMPGLDLNNGQTYHFEVRNGQYNRCEFNFTANLDTLNRTGLDEACSWTVVLEENTFEDELITISPNPFQELTKVNLWLKSPQQVSLSVYDITGKLVQNIVTNENLNGNVVFELNNINNIGVYFLKAQLGDEIVTKRIVKL